MFVTNFIYVHHSEILCERVKIKVFLFLNTKTTSLLILGPKIMNINQTAHGYGQNGYIPVYIDHNLFDSCSENIFLYETFTTFINSAQQVGLK